MPFFYAPPCPNCADRSAELVGDRSANFKGSSSDHGEGGPPKMVYIYKCNCGAVYVHTEFTGVLEVAAAGER
jgi:hypothetical protein